jgi:hypothetical protein
MQLRLLLALLLMTFMGLGCPTANDDDSAGDDDDATANDDDATGDDDDATANDDDATGDDDDATGDDDDATGDDDDSAGDDDDATGDDDDSAGDDDDDDDSAGDDDDSASAQEATADNDTFTTPLFDVNFQGSGAPNTFDADDDISAPLGDTEDWISFRTPSPQQATVGMTFELTCSADAPINVVVEIWTGGSSPTATSDQVNCAVGTDTFQLDVATDYLARVHWFPAQTTQVYSTWDLNICYGVGC